MLRLIRAFQKLIDPDTRRMVLLYVEEQVHKQQAVAVVEHTPASECIGKSPPGVGRGTTEIRSHWLADMRS
ncbi:hypothetical protein IVB11_22235 [Bradyrhizobium sp. 177]|nr:MULTISPECIES: hypothetical protein [unclassified Bradyrhizobium]MCK1268762.1 hypothetical protein [Bradyrhizobium sp. 84]MCK1371257.1 hypothetical protein [Bradyrhizobium sp. 49]MCK1413114.1 hypothetical protein [Bradyrhizobium sp. CW4]MCK1551691.1 hypothetical protein [Bradyrhizobium sp. 177]